MSSREFNTTIDGDEYKVFKENAKSGINLKFRVTKIIGAPLMALFDGFVEEGDGDDFNVEAFSTVLKDLDPDVVTDLLVELCEKTWVNGKKLNFDLNLSDKPYSTIYKIAYWVLEVNFKDFLVELLGSDLLTTLQTTASREG